MFPKMFSKKKKNKENYGILISTKVGSNFAEKFRGLLKDIQTERKKCQFYENVVKQTLNEAITALGDIPAEDCTEQQKGAYELCVETRDNLVETQQEEEK